MSTYLNVKHFVNRKDKKVSSTFNLLKTFDPERARSSEGGIMILKGTE